MHQPPASVRFGIVCGTLICATLIGCSDQHRPSAQIPPPSSDKHLLAQPQLELADGEIRLQGTAFFVRAPDGTTAAITASHYLDQQGPPLVRVSFLPVFGSTPTALAESSESWGLPGNNGLRPPKDRTDLRTDLFILPTTVDDQLVQVLELDHRPDPSIRERVWLPDKQPSEPGGFRLVEGTVIEIDPGYICVQLDSRIKPQSQSGSPVISQFNGKVIGHWAGTGQG